MLAALAVLSVGLTGVSPVQAGTAAPAEWPLFRGGPTRQGSDVASLITPGDVATLNQAWHADIGTVISSPAVVGGIVYVGASEGGLFAFPARCPPVPSCAPLWTGATAALPTSPAVAGGVAYLSSTDGTLYAFDAAGVQGCSGTPKTCAPLWTASTNTAVSASSPAVAGGKVYIGSDDGNLYAFDAVGVTNCSGSPRTCVPLWTGPTGGGVHSSPAVAAGVVYVGSDDHKLHAFDATSGTPLWTATTGDVVAASPAVVNGVVHVGSIDGNLYAFDASGTVNCSGVPKTCTPLWTAATGATFSSPAVANGVVFVGSFDKKLYAFDAAGVTNCSGMPRTCTPLWTAPLPAPNLALIVSTPAVANGLVFIGSGPNDHSVYAFDAAGVTNCTGTPKACSPVWTGEVGKSARSSPAVAGDHLYVGTDGNGLRAFATTPAGDGAFHPQAPSRVFDSRAVGGPFGPQATRTIQLAGRAGVPATGVSSVVLNMTVTEPSAAGWLTVSPSGTARPLASSINFEPGQTIANTVVVKVGPTGAIDVFNFQGSTHVVIDVEGWFGSASWGAGTRYTPLVPWRLIDTRSVGIGPGRTLSLAVAGQGGVPAGATAVVLNVTVTDPTAGGWLTVSPTGTPRPLASNINFAPGQTVANKVFAQIGAGGNVDIYNFVGTAQVLVDVEGWFGPAGSGAGVLYHPVVPARVADTRTAGDPVGPGATLALIVTGAGGVPVTGVAAVMANVTVTEPSTGGWLTVFPSGTARPVASTINFAPGQTIANSVVAKVGAGGQVDFYNFQGDTHVVVDVQGWFG